MRESHARNHFQVQMFPPFRDLGLGFCLFFLKDLKEGGKFDFDDQGSEVRGRAASAPPLCGGNQVISSTFGTSVKVQLTY